MSFGRPRYETHGEFALDGDGRNGNALALSRYQVELSKLLTMISSLKEEIAQKEKQLAMTMVMPKDPAGSYWKWQGADRTGRYVYSPSSKSNHQIQLYPWSELYMRKNGNAYEMTKTPNTGVDPYPENGVVVQSKYGCLYIPGKMLTSLIRKTYNAQTEYDPVDAISDKYNTDIEQLAYLLEQI